MNALKWVFFAFLLLLFLCAKLIKQQSGFNTYLDTQIQLAVADLKQKPSQALNHSGSIFVYETNDSITEQALIKQIQAKKNRSDYFSLWSLGQANYITASAAGIDRKHHIVNAYLEGYQSFHTDNIWLPLFTLAKHKTYQLDHLQYKGRQEVWQTSKQAFYYTRGDCEDHAIILADWLISLGEDARVVLGKHKNQGHAWVLLLKNNKQYVLEATQKRRLKSLSSYPLASLATNYHPQMMFNRDTFWYNSGPMYTTDYTDKKWLMKSRYDRSIRF